jgi:hypothetical protein
MSITYKTLDDGTVQTQQPDGSWITPLPNAAERALFDAQVARWTDLVVAACKTYGLPMAMVFGILGIIQGESGGRADIGPSFDGGVGLMAITDKGLKGGHSDQELKDGALNIDIGVGKMIAKEYAVMGLDLPQIASGFNGGYGSGGAHKSTEGPWGWREYKIPSTGAHPYISRVVAVNNYAVQSLSSAVQAAWGAAPVVTPGDLPVDTGEAPPADNTLGKVLLFGALAAAVYVATRMVTK